MQLFRNEPKASVLIAVYPYFKLYARVKQEDLEKFKKTNDESLILYKFCDNVPDMELKDYYNIYKEQYKKEKEEYRAFRLSQGFTSL